MGKIFNSLSSEIMSAMKAGEKAKAQALKNIKAKLLEFKTSSEGAKIVNANGGEIPEANEITVIKKYVKSLKDSAAEYTENGREDLATEYNTEVSYLEVYLPKEASAADVNTVIMKYIEENGDFDQKKMGMVVKYVKAALPSAEGSLIATQIKAYLNSNA